MDHYEVIKKLIGPIEPIGETESDEKRFENLQDWIQLTETMLQDLQTVARENKNRREYSMKKAGEAAAKFLNQWGN